jgi:hypothetical protein
MVYFTPFWYIVSRKFWQPCPLAKPHTLKCTDHGGKKLKEIFVRPLALASGAMVIVFAAGTEDRGFESREGVFRT